MKVVGVDSMTVIYAGFAPRKDSTTSKELTTRALLLFNMLFREKATIILPAVSVGEILVPVPSVKKPQLIAALSRHFVLPPYDTAASAIASDLEAAHKKLPPTEQYKERHVMKADTMVIASAKVLGGTVFYSHDKKCRKIASLIMDAEDLPENDPGDMFAVGDIERGTYDATASIAEPKGGRKRKRKPKR